MQRISRARKPIRWEKMGDRCSRWNCPTTMCKVSTTFNRRSNGSADATPAHGCESPDRIAFMLANQPPN